VWGFTAIGAIFRANITQSPFPDYERGSSTIPAFRCKAKVQRETYSECVWRTKAQRKLNRVFRKLNFYTAII